MYEGEYIVARSKEKTVSECHIYRPSAKVEFEIRFECKKSDRRRLAAARAIARSIRVDPNAKPAE